MKSMGSRLTREHKGTLYGAQIRTLAKARGLVGNRVTWVIGNRVWANVGYLVSGASRSWLPTDPPVYPLGVLE